MNIKLQCRLCRTPSRPSYRGERIAEIDRHAGLKFHVHNHHEAPDIYEAFQRFEETSLLTLFSSPAEPELWRAVIDEAMDNFLERALLSPASPSRPPECRPRR